MGDQPGLQGRTKVVLVNGPRPAWRLQLESIAAGMISSALVSGLQILIVLWRGFEYSESTKLFILIVATFAGLFVGAQYLRNRGSDS